jgi:NAD(P)H dehydrogenase (quinone)
MKILTLFLVAASTATVSLSTNPPPLATPNPIYEASSYSTKVASTTNGVLYSVNAPDTAPLRIMHVYGTAHERGVAHGSLLSNELAAFMTTDLEAYYAIIFGTPTLFGMMAGQMKSFLDQAGGLWARNALVGKVAAVFTSTGSQHGGHEATLLSTQIPLQHFGMLIAGMPYTFAGQTTAEGIVGGAPYGAGTIAGADGARSPAKTDLAGARFQGAYVARIAARLAGANLPAVAA